MTATQVIMKVVSRSANRAEFVFAPSELTERSRTFVNRKFGSYTDGQLVAVRFRISARGVRYVLSVFAVEEGDGTYIHIRSKYDRKFSVPTPPEAPKPEPEIELITKEELEKIAQVPERKTFGSETLHGIYIDKKDRVAFESAIALSKIRPVNVMIVGPSGYGKTSMPEALARNYGMDFVRINCAQVRDPEEWFGYREARDGSTVFVPTEFTNAVRNGNAMIVLDEFNRVEPWLHNTLYPLLDHARKTNVHGEVIECGKNLIFVATMNLGYQFVGTFAIDAALANRMDMTIHVKPLVPAIEIKVLVSRTSANGELASKIVTIMNALRKLAADGKINGDVSTRTSIKVAEFAALEIMDIEDVFSLVVLNAFSEEEAKIAIDTIRSISR